MKPAILGHLSPFARIIFVLMLLLSGLILTLLIGVLVAIPLFHVNLMTDIYSLTDLKNPVAVGLMKYLQIIQSIGLFIIPPVLAGYFFERRPLGYLGLMKKPGLKLILTVVVLMVVSIPMINWLITMNEGMQLPSFLNGLETWMKDSEEQAAQLTTAFLDVHTTGGFLLNILMIAILPAVGEELLFRGLLQRLFGEWFRNVHVGIFITAFFFGVVHLQFYGLLPRVALGVLFGYLYFLSGSIWAPITAHFLNNGAVVIASYLANLGIISANYEEFGNTTNVFLITGSILFSVALMFFVSKNSGKSIHPEQKMPLNN
jgi:uncharacterized protein